MTGPLTGVDLVVVGAGPAGLATALHAARAGLDTVVFEPRPAPVDKACGEGLMPGAVRALAGLGVHPAGRPFRGIRYLGGGTTADALFRDGQGLGVRRTVLQAALLAAVEAAGVRLEPRRADRIAQDDAEVRVDGLRARYLAVADGLHSPTALRLGLRAPGPPASRRPRRWGVRQHFAVEPWTDLVEVHWAERSEAYVTPVGPALVGVAVLSESQAPFARQLEAFPGLRERLPWPGITPARGAGPLRQPTSARVAGRALLVGDAAGYLDALTGEGIAVALACARALVECVAADDPDAYERRWSAATRRYRLLTASLLWARRNPLLGPRIVPAARGLPWAFTAAVRQLAL